MVPIWKWNLKPIKSFVDKTNASDAKGDVKNTKELVDITETILYWKKKRLISMCDGFMEVM